MNCSYYTKLISYNESFFMKESFPCQGKSKLDQAFGSSGPTKQGLILFCIRRGREELDNSLKPSQAYTLKIKQPNLSSYLKLQTKNLTIYTKEYTSFQNQFGNINLCHIVSFRNKSFSKTIVNSVAEKNCCKSLCLSPRNSEIL